MLKKLTYILLNAVILLMGGNANALTPIAPITLIDPLPIPTATFPISTSQHLLKSGYWTFSYYQDPLENKVTTAGYCFSAGNTWGSAGLIIINENWSGAWLQQGDSFHLYGTQNGTGQGNIISLTGQVIGTQSIVGRYVSFNAQQPMPNGNFGAFKATYNGPACPG